MDALAASTSPGTAQALVSALVMLSVRTGRVRTRRARRKSPASSPVDVPRRELFIHVSVVVKCYNWDMGHGSQSTRIHVAIARGPV